MTLRQRRDQLQAEVLKLLDIVVDYHIDVPSNRIENPFMDELEAQLQRKTEELNELNARVDSPLYRFRENSHGIQIAIWSMSAMLCAATVLMAPFLERGYVVAIAIASIASVLWAIWSSRLPSA